MISEAIQIGHWNFEYKSIPSMRETGTIHIDLITPTRRLALCSVGGEPPRWYGFTYFKTIQITGPVEPVHTPVV